MLIYKRVVHPHGSEISASRQAAVKAKKAYNSAKGIMGLEVLQLMPCKESTSFETTVPVMRYSSGTVLQRLKLSKTMMTTTGD